MSDIMLAVSKLDGCLYAIGMVSGKIGEYSSGAILLDADNCKESIESAIRDYFPSDATFQNFIFENSDLGQLEQTVQSYLLRDILGQGGSYNEEALEARKKYVAFRIMDMVDCVIGDIYKPTVYKVSVKLGNPSSECIFFTVNFDARTLALQFIQPKT